jgi:hypothetical protein
VLTGQFINGTTLLPDLQVPTTITVRGQTCTLAFIICVHGPLAVSVRQRLRASTYTPLRMPCHSACPCCSQQTAHPARCAAPSWSPAWPCASFLPQGGCTTLGGLCILDAKQLGRVFHGAGPWIKLTLINMRIVNGNARDESALFLGCARLGCCAGCVPAVVATVRPGFVGCCLAVGSFQQHAEQRPPGAAG